MLRTVWTLMVRPMQALYSAPVHWSATQYPPNANAAHYLARSMQSHHILIVTLPFYHSMSILRNSSRPMRPDRVSNRCPAPLNKYLEHNRFSLWKFRCVLLRLLLNDRRHFRRRWWWCRHDAGHRWHSHFPTNYRWVRWIWPLVAIWIGVVHVSAVYWIPANRHYRH